MWTNARAHNEQEYIFAIYFSLYNRKKIKPANTTFQALQDRIPFG